MWYALFEVETVCLDDVFETWTLQRDINGGTQISFVWHVNDLFMKYSIPQYLLASVRTFPKGVNAELTVLPRSLICSHFCIELPSAPSDRIRRWSGGPPFDRWWFLLAFTGRSHLRGKLSSCWFYDLSSCCYLLEATSFTSSAKNKWMQVGSSARSFINIRNRSCPSKEPLSTPLFTIP